MLQYDIELSRFPNSYIGTFEQDISELVKAIESTGESNIVAVGSGASYTAAILLCSLHEYFTGVLCRALTPLELINNPLLAKSSSVYIFSSEGKNPDVLRAVEVALEYSRGDVNIILNREGTPLYFTGEKHENCNIHIFPSGDKDGYLGTNSLVVTSSILMRVYCYLDEGGRELPKNLEGLMVNEMSLMNFMENGEKGIPNFSHVQTIILLYSISYKAAAIDFESKVSESTLFNCQVVDLRSFAHGRHLWLSERLSTTAIISMVDNEDQKLWDYTAGQIPTDATYYVMKFNGGIFESIISSLYAQMILIGFFARTKNIDIGKPKVPEFGKKIHYIPVDLLPAIRMKNFANEKMTKAIVLGRSWPDRNSKAGLERSSHAARLEMVSQRFRAIVFDYDGVLCRSTKKNKPPESEIVRHVISLLEHGIIVGIATGRGGSVRDSFRGVIPKKLQSSMYLGLYNGGEKMPLAGW